MNSKHGLVFYAKNLQYVPKSRNALLASLQAGGFIGRPFTALQQQKEDGGPTGYLIGEEFLKLITFLGCSPHIEVTPPEQLTDWGNFCYIEMQQFPSAQYFKGLNQPKCSCPKCKSRVTKALSNLEQWFPGSQQVVCPKCQQSTLFEQLNWRHGAGFGRFIIRINSIYPNEAVPTDKLMELLKSDNLEDWDYFYFEQ